MNFPVKPVIYLKTYRRWAVTVDGPTDRPLRAYRRRPQQIHLGPQVDMIAGLGLRSLDQPSAVGLVGGIHEDVDLANFTVSALLPLDIFV